MRKRQTNRRKYLLKRIFTCQKTESNEIGWQTAANTSIYRGCKSFFGQINLHWQQAVPVAHNAKYAVNKSKLTNTNSGGGVRVTSPRGRGKRHSLGGHRMGALEHATTAAATWRPRKAGREQKANSCCAANVKVASSREK